MYKHIMKVLANVQDRVLNLNAFNTDHYRRVVETIKSNALSVL